MKSLIWTALFAGLVVLAWHPGNGVRASTDRLAQRAILVDSIDPANHEQAPVRIERASIQDDLLLVDVSYVGGCKVHDFKLRVATDNLRTTPRRADAALGHRAYGDPCKTEVSESLRFDLIALENELKTAVPAIEGDGQTVTLRLADQELTYIY